MQRPSLMLSSCILALAACATGQYFQGDLVYSRFNSTASDPFRIKKVAVTYDNQGFRLGARTAIARGIGADGIVFSQRGTILVGGGGSRRLCEIDPTTGAKLGCSGRAGQPIFHVSLDPKGSKAWTSNQPGGVLFEVPLSPALGTPIAHTVTGDRLTQIVFTPTGVYYSKSRPNGKNSTFGAIDLSTFRARPQIVGMDGFHGVVYDAYTGHVFAFGSRFITQIDAQPGQSTIVARVDVTTLPGVGQIGASIDQGTTNGSGLVFAAVNGNASRRGELIFLDITKSRSVAQPDFSAAPPLDTYLDDVAPLSGLGCSASAVSRNYGAGWPGSKAGIPSLVSTLPRVGQTARIDIGNSSSKAVAACIFVGDGIDNKLTSYGGTILVNGSFGRFGFMLPGAGTAITFPVPAVACGSEFFLQTIQLDPAASHGISFSKGLRLRFGN